MNFVLYIVFISSYVLSGQDEKNWIIRSNVIDRASSIDTMGIIHDEADGKVLVSSKKRLIRIVATIGTILGPSSLSFNIALKLLISPVVVEYSLSLFSNKNFE